MEKLKPLGETFTKAMIAGYVFLAVFVFLVILDAVLVVKYIKKKRESVENGEKINFVPLRISVYAVSGTLAFLIAIGALL